jgi:carbonic anhydrase
VSATTSADEALARLLEGNRRFVAGAPLHPGRDAARRAELAGGQAPFAIVLGCADSRVPPEVVFDAGLGELFVVRVAGNTASDAAVLGSVEYAATALACPLLLVLGHEACGAVGAAVDAIEEGAAAEGSIADAIAPIVSVVEELAGREPALAGERLAGEAVRANVRSTVAALAEGPVVGELAGAGRLKLVAAEYRLADGEVAIL